MTTSVSASTTSATTSTAATAATVGATSLTGNSVDGLVSGLNTTDIINKLMSINAQPQTDLKTKLTKDQAVVAAYKKIQTDVAALKAAAQAITSPTSWSATTATSSDASVAVTSSSTASLGAMTFRVTHLAAGQSDVTPEVASTAATIATGPITITSSTGVTTPITAADGSMATVASAINAATATTGVRATIVQTGASAFRLQLSSTATGSQSGYTVSGLSTTNLTAATDATLTVGDGPGAYTVTSSTNAVTGLMPGTTLQLKALTPAGQTVSVSVTDDVNAHATKVKALVDAANVTLTEIATDTAYDASSGRTGVLNGNVTVRGLADRILSGVSTGIGGLSLASLGVGVTKDGQLSFDSSVFVSGYSADPVGMLSRLAGTGSFTATGGASATAARVIGGSASTSPLSLEVTQAPARATGTIPTGGLAAGQSFTVAASGKSASVTVGDGWGAAELATALSTAAQKAGVAATTAVGADGSVTVTAAAYGAASALSLTGTAVNGSSITLPAVTPGTDAAGTVAGVSMIGAGSVLVAPYGTHGPVAGLSVQLLGSGTGSLGTVSWTAGLAQIMAGVADAAIDPVSGTLTTDIAGHLAQEGDLTTRIADWDTRLATQRAALQSQYASLESALGKLKDESSWLSSQINALTSSG